MDETNSNGRTIGGSFRWSDNVGSVQAVDAMRESRVIRNITDQMGNLIILSF